MTQTNTAVLTIENLTIDLPSSADRRHAVREISFQVAKGEIVCLVGESGSGKSVIAQAVMGLLPQTLRHANGPIRYLREK